MKQEGSYDCFSVQPLICNKII